MKISLNWINDYVDIKDIDVQWLVERFTVTTAEIEEVHQVPGDIIIEIDNKSLTHRPDLWCHYGIAREIAAITHKSLKDIDYISTEQLKSSKPALEVKIEDKEKCLRYSAIKINNIKVITSPEIISERLTNCGLRPINILVDIANYVMLDVGQPLHTFDQKDIKLIKVSSLTESLKFKTLDDEERELPKDTLMICSKDKPLAVAGIIGGEESAVSENTNGIILEAATFEGTAIRKSAKALGIRTDASARYEKFLDTSITTVAIGRFIKLLQQYQPEMEIVSSLYDNIISEIKTIDIEIQHSYIETYLGNSISVDKVMEILKSLQFVVEKKEDLYLVTVPTFRATRDISCRADIIEEILRVYGYDNIKGKPYMMDVVPVEKNTMMELQYSIKDLLVKKFNFNEVHTYSWFDNQWLKKLGYTGGNTLRIENSGVKQFEKLRNDIVPNLLKVIDENRKNFGEIKAFEIGRIFLMENGELTQPRHLTAAIYSYEGEEEVYRDIKGICSYLLSNIKNIKAEYIHIEETEKEQCLNIYYKGISLGQIYSIPISVFKLYSSSQTLNVLDIDLEKLNDVPKEVVRYKPISRHPETYLDFSILTSKETAFSCIQALVDKFVHPLILGTNYIDTYTGENVPENMKSTTIRITLGDNNRALQVEEINCIKELFVEYLSNNGMKLR